MWRLDRGSLTRREPCEAAPKLRRRDNVEADSLEFSAESRGVEAISLGMVKKATRNRVNNEVSECFFAVKATTRLENSLNLAQNAPPVGNMMDDPEVEDGIIRCV
jgi:hypothetical protein